MNPYPIHFRPVLKQTIWGGRRLGDQLGKSIGSESNYAESWEVVDHGDDQSVVENGPLAGQTLASVIAKHRDWLLGDQVPAEETCGGRDQSTGLASNRGLASNTGPASSVGSSFPLLLKYLDCNRVLSVQVHPSDQYALQMEHPDLGKTEAWYIVAADPGSLIYAGLKPEVDRALFEQAIEAGQAEQVLHAFHPRPGDIVFIPAGTVHALGAGLLVAEIQQSSDTTFRLFDWNRVDASGKGRPLHLKQGLEVSDYTSGPVSARRSDLSVSGWQSMVACEKFILRVVEKGKAGLAGDGKFHIVTVPRGEATLRTDQDVTVLRAGDTVLLPAAMTACEVTVAADSTLLEMHLP